MNLKRIKNTICATLLAATMILPGITAYAAPEATTEQQLKSADNLIKKVIKSTNEYVTYQDESFTFLFEQESQGTENGETTNANTVAIGDEGKVTISDVSQNLSTSVDNGTNVMTTMSNASSYWTRTVYGGIDLNAFDTEGIYTYLVTEQAHGTSSNSLATWTDSKAQYRLRVYVENVGSNVPLAKTVTVEQLKDQNGDELSETKKVTELEFDNSVTAPTFALTKFVEGDEDPRAKEKGYPFIVRYKDYTNITELKYLLKDGDNPVDLTTVYTVENSQKGYSWFYLKKGQTAIFINLPTTAQIEKVQEGKDSGKNGLEYGAPDLGVTKIKYDVYYDGVRNDSKSSSGSKKSDDKGELSFSSENSLSNLDVKSTGTKLDWTNICEDEVILTGVVTDIAPYVTLVVVAAAAVIAYIVFKNKMR